jgi:hypothetical protein
MDFVNLIGIYYNFLEMISKKLIAATMKVPKNNSGGQRGLQESKGGNHIPIIRLSLSPFFIFYPTRLQTWIVKKLSYIDLRISINGLTTKGPWVPYVEFSDSGHAAVNAIIFWIFETF